MLDDIDRRILRRLQDQPSLTMPELGEAVGITAARATRRLERMREAGAYRGVRTDVDWAALGYGVEVSLRFTLDKTQARAFDEFMAAAREVAQVIEIQTFLGKVDVRLKVIARDMADYQRLYRAQILALPHIADIEALMHVARVKSEPRLPI